MSTPTSSPPPPVEHVLDADERGGVHRVPVAAGVEHRFTIHERPYIDVGPIEILSVDGGASVFFTFGTDVPAAVDSPDATMMPPAIGSVVLTTGLWSPTIVRLIADGPVVVTVQRAQL